MESYFFIVPRKFLAYNNAWISMKKNEVQQKSYFTATQIRSFRAIRFYGV